MTARDNLDVNHPPQIKLELSTEVFDGESQRMIPGEGYVLTDPGLLTIKDNDGEDHFRLFQISGFPSLVSIYAGSDPN